MIKTETRTVPNFTAIDVGTGIEAEVSLGPLAPVEVRCDDNLLPHIVTEVSGDRLTVRVKNGRGDSIAPSQRIHVRAVAPELIRLSVGSGATLDAKGLRGAKLNVDVASGGSITGAGSAGALQLHASSGAKVELAALSAGEVELKVSSGARATVTATAAISGSAASGGRVTVKGKPAKRDVQEESGGRVEYE